MRITMPPDGRGCRLILADGVIVGRARRLWHQAGRAMIPEWRAGLWLLPAGGPRALIHEVPGQQVVYRIGQPSLSLLRREVRRIAAREGPWWKTAG